MKTICSLSVLLLVVALIGCEAPSEAQLDLTDPGQLQAQTDFTSKHSNPFVGSWRIESAILGDIDLDGRMTLVIFTFSDDGDYSVSVSRDVDHLVCGAPQIDCAWSGTYSYTRTEVTTVDVDGPDSSSYTFSCGRLILMDNEMKITLVRTGRA